MVVVENSKIHRNGVLVMITRASGGGVCNMDVIQLILQKHVQNAANAQINVVEVEEEVVVVEEEEEEEEEVVVVEEEVVVVEEEVVVVVCKRF
jgi:hypothetical protein